MSEIEIPQPEEVNEKSEHPFTRTVALFVAFYAVGLAFASFGGHNASKEMIMAKQNEANTWNRYQGKSTREALYRNEIWKLEAEEKMKSPLPADKAALLTMYRAEEVRMIKDKKMLESGGNEDGGEIIGARHYQEEVKLMQKKDTFFDMAEVGFQLSIVMASVSMLSRKRWAFAGSILLAVAALGLTSYGFALPSVPQTTHEFAAHE